MSPWSRSTPPRCPRRPGGRQAKGVTSLYLAFKSPESTVEVRHPVLLFVAKVKADAVARDGELGDKRRVRWVFGAPSGWSGDRRRAYADLLRSAGLQHVDVVPESRAAMLYARESMDITIGQDQLSGSIVVTDVGSSTTDFTRVLGYHTGPPIDTGVQLGAGLIDRTILERQLERHSERKALEELLHNNRLLRLRLELLCREVKEMYFRTDPSRFADDPDATVGGVHRVQIDKKSFYFDIELTAADMEAVLDAPSPVSRAAPGGRRFATPWTRSPKRWAGSRTPYCSPEGHRACTSCRSRPGRCSARTECCSAWNQRWRSPADWPWRAG